MNEDATAHRGFPGNIEVRAGHPVVAEIERAAARKLTEPGHPVKAVMEAIELLK